MSALIEVSDLTIGWEGEPPLIEHVTFDVRQGEIFAILGRSGAGKSTLFRFLIGLAEPREGVIKIAGEEHRELIAARPRFGVMFQEGALFGSMTVGDNVALPIATWSHLPKDAVQAMVRAKLRLVGLEDAEEKLPSALSGGMHKRAAIARALALEPPLLFLDEPSSGLDPISSAELDQLIRSLRAALCMTVVLVTHELGSIFAIADRCILLDADEKRVVAEGNPRELAKSTDQRVSRFFRRAVERTP